MGIRVLFSIAILFLTNIHFDLKAQSEATLEETTEWIIRKLKNWDFKTSDDHPLFITECEYCYSCIVKGWNKEYRRHYFSGVDIEDFQFIENEALEIEIEVFETDPYFFLEGKILIDFSKVNPNKILITDEYANRIIIKSLPEERAIKYDMKWESKSSDYGKSCFIDKKRIVPYESIQLNFDSDLEENIAERMINAMSHLAKLKGAKVKEDKF